MMLMLMIIMFLIITTSIKELMRNDIKCSGQQKHDEFASVFTRYVMEVYRYKNLFINYKVGPYQLQW